LVNKNILVDFSELKESIISDFPIAQE